MNIQWIKDDVAGFDVIFFGLGQLAGNGSWNFGGTPGLSPSGTWSVSSGDIAVWQPATQDWSVNGGGAVNLLPNSPLLLTFNTFHNFTPREFVLITVNRPGAGSGLLAWAAQMSFAVLKIDPTNPATWTWLTRYSGQPR